MLNHTLTAGELGCYCNHREIWLKMVKDNIPYALIIKDDAIRLGFNLFVLVTF
nr:glycosyltransferase family 25 protein [Rickettsia parkeri]